MSATITTLALNAAKTVGKAAAKRAAKNAAKGAAKKAGRKITGASEDKKPKQWEKILNITVIILSLIVVGILVLGGAGYGFVGTLTMGKSDCTVILEGSPAGSESSGGDFAADGTFGSNVPFPTTSTSEVHWPIKNGKSMISSEYGWRGVVSGTADFFGNGMFFHNGTDFGAPFGTPVLAMADGIIAQSGPNFNGYGTVVTIHHLIDGKQYSTTYGHVIGSSLKFKVGDTVKGGQQIAAVGAEGNSAGPHLHFVLTDGVYTDRSEWNNKGPQNNIDPIQFLEGKGAVQSGGDGSTTPTEDSPLTTCGKSNITLEAGQYQQYAASQLPARGWTRSEEMRCLENMWNRESNWDPAAANPTSTARGIPQMMMNIHFGADWETNAKGREYLDDPKKQIDVGLDYIQGRYQTPCNAWEVWQTQEWY